MSESIVHYGSAAIRRQSRTVSLRCRVAAIEGTYTAPNLLKTHLSDAERMRGTLPMAFKMILSGDVTDLESLAAVDVLSRPGAVVTVRVEVGE